MQLTYGDDGLDPVAMEAQEGKPVDLARSLSVVHATTPRQPWLPENAMEEGVIFGMLAAHVIVHDKKTFLCTHRRD